jgi:non-specific serine/threonine protein kinase/serine/threonine-protein kinase
MSLGEAGGTMIDRYHLLQKVGEGGMGEVWLAEQKEPVQRRVALKLVKGGVNSREVVARFESERQALALMDHPAIAKVFDAGATPEGAPYFVMEYIAGVSITSYCDKHRLTTEERLELFLRVCEGVQHAHQKAIIHRDLKPSNILVTEVDGKAAPKIIDFGVAKALTQKLTGETMFTRLGALVGTPEYMSPEQACTGGEDIDTRSDVYSLGIILYELLAGARPLDLRKIALDEFLRRLREDDPPKPSTRIRTQDPATSSTTAHNRQTEPVALARQIRGDLDSIVLKALEKDRSRRYGSPSEFGADIGRFLRKEVVLAVPPSTGYRARKFARRHRVALATVFAFALVLVAAAAISIRQSVRANREAAAAEAVNDFLQNDLLAQASASNQSGGGRPDPDLKVRTALDRAAARIAGKFDRQPEVEAAIQDTIGAAYRDLGQYADAHNHLQRAADLYRRTLGTENAKTIATMRHLANTAVLQAHYAEAETLLSQTLQSARRVLGPEHRDTLGAMANLAITYYRQLKYPQAEALLNQTLQLQRRVLGADHINTMATMNTLANTYYYQGKFAEAEPLYSQIGDIFRRKEGAEHPNTLTIMNNLAMTQYLQGKYADSEPVFRQVLEIRRRILGPEHPQTQETLSEMASMYQRQGKYREAETYAAESMRGAQHTFGPENARTIKAENDLALAYVSQGKFTESETLARQAVEIDRKKRPDEWERFRAESLLGASLTGQKKYAEAEPLLVGACQQMAAKKGGMPVQDWYQLDRAREWTVQLYEAWGKPEKAAAFKNQ